MSDEVEEPVADELDEAEEPVEPAEEAESSDDADFADYLSESEKRAVREAEVIDAQDAVDERAGEDVIAFNLAELARLGKWDQFPIAMLDRLDEGQFEQFIEWRSMQPADELDGDDEDEQPMGSYLEPVTEDSARALLQMSEREFVAHLRGLSEGVAE